MGLLLHDTSTLWFLLNESIGHPYSQRRRRPRREINQGVETVASLRGGGGGGRGAARPGCHHFGVTTFGNFIWSSSFIWTKSTLFFRRRLFFGLHLWTKNPLNFRRRLFFGLHLLLDIIFNKGVTLYKE